MSEIVVVINPGSSSTKFGVYSFSEQIFKIQLPGNPPPVVSLYKMLEPYLAKSKIVAIVSRGGLLRPLPGGVYLVDDSMLSDLRENKYGKHASNLGAQIASELALEFGVPAFIVDPVTTDEFESLARISGVPGIERISRGHFLNIKAIARQASRDLDCAYISARFIVAHLGGGISIAALKYGRIIDINDALLGMGPFSPQRAGSLPLRSVLDLAYRHSRSVVEKLLSKSSGLAGYLGTDDMLKIERRIIAGDQKTKLIVDAMVYQIAKEIGAMTTVLRGRIQGIIITGGLANSEYIVKELEERIRSLGKILIYPGEMELKALAQGAWRVLNGEETVLKYD
ncbi:MAG: butyrate kinase [Candidatus Marinimicrobia bacterium]|nr:butyrate kinase [Candidatus Neomarinimicrobiota bacterium]